MKAWPAAIAISVLLLAGCGEVSMNEEFPPRQELAQYVTEKWAGWKVTCGS